MSQFSKILVTGGAGFIGSFLVDELIKKGYSVRIFDNLEEQVHGGKKPSYLNKGAEFIKGDVRNYEQFKKAISGIDIIFHFASSVGVAQSNYEIKKYLDTNVEGTANLADILVNHKNTVKKVLVASSMTGYGEGNYLCKKCGVVRPRLRDEKQLKTKDWNLYCPRCENIVKPIPTDENAQEYPTNIYAISKKTQQDILLTIGKIYKIPTVALRLFNVYGPRQSLSNPYTGVTAIFISRFKNNQDAVIYEDGLQTRDFVSVHDVVAAFISVMENDQADHQIFNIGSSKPTAIKKIAETLKKLLKSDGKITITNKYRKSDVRHCFANINKAKKLLGWEPKISLERGFKELIEWGSKEKAVDMFTSAEKELKTKGLL